MSFDDKEIKFIDLFAGIGGIRKGFQQACLDNNLISKCVFTSEIKPYAVKVLKQNYNEEVYGDITKIKSEEIPDFDVLLAGFPCQAFSSAGKRLGFQDTRGTLFFEVERIIKDKQPKGFLLENVDALVTHDKLNSSDEMGNTFTTILSHLALLGYKVEWKILNSKYFGVPQERKRVYILGTKTEIPTISNYEIRSSYIKDILEEGLPCENSIFISKLLNHYSVDSLYGKSIKDKRGGKDNIHSWDIELKGGVTKDQKDLLQKILTERRKKVWAVQYGIDWMDGMPLTIEQIKTFIDFPNLQEMLTDLVKRN